MYKRNEHEPFEQNKKILLLYERRVETNEFYRFFWSRTGGDIKKIISAIFAYHANMRDLI